MAGVLRPEAQFLLASVREDGPEQLQKLIGTAFDWEYLFQCADLHALIAVVYRTLYSLPSEAVPGDVLERFRVQASKVWARNVALKKKLVSILKLFQENEIPVISYKGPVLTERLYGDIGLRYFDDLDLLVRKQDVLKCKELLLANGYRPKKDLQHLTKAQEKSFLAFQYSYDFISYYPAHQLEIHWEVVGRNFSLPMDYEGIWKRAVSTSFEDSSVLAFSPEDMFLVLCIAGAKKVWDRLSRVSDIDRTLAQYPQLDWQELLARSKSARAERILYLGLSLASTLLGAKIPEDVKSKMAGAAQVNALTALFTERMFRLDALTVVRPEDQFQPLHLRMRERFADRFRYCAGVILTPGVGEWAILTLPDSIYFLYYLVRPPRLLLKGVRRSFYYLLARVIFMLKTRKAIDIARSFAIIALVFLETRNAL